MSTAGGGYNVQPVVKALHVLDYVVRQGRDVTLSEAVRALKLPKTTLFRYLQTLSNEGLLHYDLERDRYRCGSRFRALAQVDRDFKELRDATLPEMTKLQKDFDETVNLAVLSDACVVYLDIVSGARCNGQARVGHRDPVHSTSLGKAIIAHMPEPDAAAVSRGGFEQRTFRTLTDMRQLMRQVEDVRRRGYAVEVGENEEGLMCIGVPILDPRGYPVAAMSLSAPEKRMDTEMTARAANALRDASSRISRCFERVLELGSAFGLETRTIGRHGAAV